MNQFFNIVSAESPTLHRSSEQSRSSIKKEDEIQSFVLAAQQGDSDAFGKVYDIFADSIYRYVYYRVGASDAEDLTELVFLKTWEHIKKFRRGHFSFSSWIFRIAHNVVVDHYRSRHTEDELSEDMQDKRREAETSFRAHQHFDQEVLKKAMAELKDHYRQVLILKYINDMSNEEIGFIMGRSQAALRILQFRALRHLRRVLERMGVTEDNL